MTEKGFTIDYMWHFGRIFITLPTSPFTSLDRPKDSRHRSHPESTKPRCHGRLFSCCETAVRYRNNNKNKRWRDILHWQIHPQNLSSSFLKGRWSIYRFCLNEFLPRQSQILVKKKKKDLYQSGSGGGTIIHKVGVPLSERWQRFSGHRSSIPPREHLYPVSFLIENSQAEPNLSTPYIGRTFKERWPRTTRHEAHFIVKFKWVVSLNDLAYVH